MLRSMNVRTVGYSVIAMGLLWMFSQPYALSSPSAEQEAQKAHAQGACSSMGPGTGLSGDKGWVVSMVPGKHQFRVRGGAGQVYVTAARLSVVDFDVGRPYYLVVEGAGPAPMIEWKIPSSDWGLVPTYFLYPLSN